MLEAKKSLHELKFQWNYSHLKQWLAEEDYQGEYECLQLC